MAIQDAMGWLNGHLHAFEILNPLVGVKINIGIPDEEYDCDRKVLSGWKEKIAKYLSLEKKAFNYIYDFGDNWEHSIKLEKILPVQDGIIYPICIAGKRACPPEDCGGVLGYKGLLEAIKDPYNEEHEEFLEWVGNDFSPEDFNIKAVVFGDPKEALKMMFD